MPISKNADFMPSFRHFLLCLSILSEMVRDFTLKPIPMLNLATTSGEAVMKATGSSWEDWIAYLDQQNAAELTHKEIVSLLSKKIESSWWQQQVTVGYEQYIGRRIPGQASSGFQMGVQTTIPLPALEVWNFIASEEGIALWLGDIVKMDFHEKGEYLTKEGVTGKITVIKQASHIRMTWKPDKWREHSVLQVRTTPKGDRTTLGFHQENLPDAFERENMRTRWKEKSRKIAELLMI